MTTPTSNKTQTDSDNPSESGSPNNSGRLSKGESAIPSKESLKTQNTGEILPKSLGDGSPSVGGTQESSKWSQTQSDLKDALNLWINQAKQVQQSSPTTPQSRLEALLHTSLAQKERQKPSLDIEQMFQEIKSKMKDLS